MSPNAARASDPSESLSAGNFRRLADLIQTYSGIKMPPAKKTMLEGRLRRRMRARGYDTVNDYCRFLFDENGFDTEVIHLIDAVTTNKTEFFREPNHFDYLIGHAVPTLAQSGRRELKVWSAAASMGAEAYTLAMVLEDYRRDNSGPDYRILGTDLCTQVLETAVRGVFTEQMIEPVPPVLRQRYLLRGRDPKSQEVRITPNLRAKTAFARLNLMDDRYAVDSDMDVIFCRNVLIYFDKPTQAAVLKRLCAHLRPGGYLFVGHSESILGVDLPVVTAASTVFRKV